MEMLLRDDEEDYCLEREHICTMKEIRINAYVGRDDGIPAIPGPLNPGTAKCAGAGTGRSGG